MHLELGEESGLPLSVHSRAAEERCLEIVKTYPAARGIFHSFTGDYVTAKKILDAGWALGVNGIVTYKNAVVLREMYKNILGEISTDWSPGDFYSKGIYFETDAPFLTPLGSKSGRNEPANINKIYEYMATI
jgi:TatD DNase family protein